MKYTARLWQDELAIIDRAMKAISDIKDPESLVQVYWESIHELLPMEDYLALSRRGVASPNYIITRSSRFTEHPNPWTERHKLPLMSGGILGEIAYANQPVIMDNLSQRLKLDDPAYFYLQGFESLVALPQYDRGEGLNVTIMLLPPGMQLDSRIIPMMHWQAGLFGRGTQNLVLRNELAHAMDLLDRELKAVGSIQRSLLPGSLPKIPGFELAAHYQTSARAGGDYYDFFPLENGAWGLFIADVSGHGTPAAVLMAITHALAHSQPGAHTPPAQLLNHLNRQLSRTYTQGGTFVTAFYAVLDPASHTLTYSVAGHNPPRLVREKKVLALDDNGALPLGISDEEIYRETEISIHAGELLVLYTDGITEAMAPRIETETQELFGSDRLDALLLECDDISAEECIGCIVDAVTQFRENAIATDDQTLIAIRCLE